MFHYEFTRCGLLPLPYGIGYKQVRIFTITHAYLMHTYIVKPHWLSVDDLSYLGLPVPVFSLFVAYNCHTLV